MVYLKVNLNTLVRTELITRCQSEEMFVIVDAYFKTQSGKSNAETQQFKSS